MNVIASLKDESNLEGNILGVSDFDPKKLDELLVKMQNPQGCIDQDKESRKMYSFKNYTEGIEHGEHGWYNLDSDRWNSRPGKKFKNEKYRIIADKEDTVIIFTKFLDTQEIDEIEGIDVERKIDTDLQMKCWNKQVLPDGTNNCFCCGISISLSDKWEVCHILPVAHGGQNILDNVAVGCVRCNRGRGGIHDMHAYEYMLSKKMPGIKKIKPGDEKLMAAKTIYRMVEDLKLNFPDIPEEIEKDLGPSKPVKVRLLAISRFLQDKL
jgi:hypothetical protein